MAVDLVVLLEAGDELPHVNRLDLSRNQLSDAGVQVLAESTLRRRSLRNMLVRNMHAYMYAQWELLLP